MNDTAQKNASTAATSKLYVYKDYSKKIVDKEETRVVTKVFSSNVPPAIRVAKLPVKLNIILSNRSFSDIITWSPHGRSWKIIDATRFIKEIIPLYFEHCNYTSFKRLINAWGFRLITKGPDNQSYYHELFLRGLPHLHAKMRRLVSKEKKLPLKPGSEPDFYALAKNHPLPEIKVEHENECNTEETHRKASTHFPRPCASSQSSTHSINNSLSMSARTMPQFATKKVPTINNKVGKETDSNSFFSSSKNNCIAGISSFGAQNMLKGLECPLQHTQNRLILEQLKLQKEQENLDARKAQVEMFQNTTTLFWQERFRSIQAGMQVQQQNEIIRKQQQLLCHAAHMSQIQLKQIESLNSVSSYSANLVPSIDQNCRHQPRESEGETSLKSKNSTSDHPRDIANMMLQLSKQE